MSRVVFEFPGTLTNDQWTSLESRMLQYMANCGHDMVAVRKAEGKLPNTEVCTRVAMCTSRQWTTVSDVIDILCDVLDDNHVIEYWLGTL